MRLTLAAALIAIPATVFAQQSTPNVAHAWSRAAMAGHQGVVYLTITDAGAPDTLTGATTPVANSAELHEFIDDHGVMKMRPVASLPVAPGHPAMLKPGGYHIMLMGLKQPLTQGEQFPLALRFAYAGQVTTTVTVEPAGAATPGMDHAGMGSMSMPKPPSR